VEFAAAGRQPEGLVKEEQTPKPFAMTNPVEGPGGPAVLSRVMDALLDRKAVDPVVLDLRGLSAATDYFVIVSGTSDAHVRGMAEHLVETLAPGVEPHHVEGLAQGRWVLLDYIDFVVHVFHPELRNFYQLERLWGDAPVVTP
jgi:ribosome-associated protein